VRCDGVEEDERPGYKLTQGQKSALDEVMEAAYNASDIRQAGPGGSGSAEAFKAAMEALEDRVLVLRRGAGPRCRQE
jgi:hypothetical protein